MFSVFSAVPNHPVIETDLGATIREYRRRRDITQAELAKEIGSDHTYISALENNRRVPSIALLEKIFKALNIEGVLLISEDGVNVSDY